MTDQPIPTPSIDVVSQVSAIDYPNGHPYSHITFAMVVWNEEERLAALLERVRPYFSDIVVGVQESSDRTLEIANEYANIVVEDQHRGFGDATFGPKVLTRVFTPWVLKLDGDEWPSDELLDSLSCATWWADHKVLTKGVWIPFKSSVDGIEYEEQHAHLRLFHTSVGWPATLHSRPPVQDGCLWQTGHIRHDRTLDEMIQDYLRYLEKGRDNEGWTAHNRLMIASACKGTADVKGWDYVRSFPWWDDVKAIVESNQ